MKSYGRQILTKGTLDILCKQKNWIINRIQYKILNFFGRFSAHSRFARWFSRTARKLIGGYIYSLKVEVNTTCTLKCKMCYVKGPGIDLPYETIIALLNQIKGYKIHLEILGGEPLLRKDICDIIDYAKKRAKVPFISLYTNGLWASPQVSASLKNAGLDAAIVSLISHKEKVHDEFCGLPGAWEKTVTGIQNLKNANLNVYTFTAIHALNYRDYKEIYRFAKNELQVSALFYQYIPQKKDDPLMIDPLEWRKIKHWLMYEKNREHADFVRKFYMISGNACSGGNFVLTVKADGSVQPCPFISDIPLGNIYRQDIWTIFKRRFQKTALAEFKSVPKECRVCSYESICGGGCKAGNRELFGRYDRKDHRCPGPYSGPIKDEKVIEQVPTFF